MPADIVSSQMLFARQQEVVVCMDDYGCCQMLYIPFNLESQRAALVADLQAAVLANQQAAQNYAASLNQTLPAALTLAQKQALWNSGQATGNIINSTTAAAAAQGGAA